MANLDDLCTWEMYVPRIGNNKSLPQPFHLLIKCGMSILEFSAFVKEWKAAPDTTEGQAAILESMVKMGPEPLTVGGKPIESLRAYLDLVFAGQGLPLYQELIGAILNFNSVQGTQALFSERLSGGGVSIVFGRNPQAAAGNTKH